MSKSKGFTLIELVVVLVILGILAAFAVPRFYSFTSAANFAILNGLAGAINSAIVTTHAAAIATNQASSATGSVTLEGNPVALVYGYPAATAGLQAAISYSAANFTVAPASPIVTFSITGGQPSTTCGIVYTQATAAVAASIAITGSSTTC